MSPSFDQALKALAEYDPDALLRCVGALRPNESATITTPPRELRTPTRIADLLYDVQSGKRRRLVHIEAQTRYHSSLPRRVLEYAALAWIRHRIPVASYVLLLTARDCPASLARRTEMKAGGLRMRYQRIKLWEIAADEVLAWDRPGLWPLVPLMRGDESTLRRVVQRIRQLPDDADRRELAFRFLLLGGLRYDSNYLRQLLEIDMITLEDLSESSFYQFIEKKGIEKGLEKGLEQGEVRLLSRQLEQRFGTLPSWAVDKVRAASLDTLEGWGLRILEPASANLEELLV